MDKIVYKLYTIKELSDWLCKNWDNGLSEFVISKPRAWAFINNPYVSDNTVVLVVVFDNNKAIGYTGVFPDMLQKPMKNEIFYWGSSQYLDPNYRGSGIAGKMMYLIKNAVNNRYLGIGSSDASVKLDKRQGSLIYFFPWYYIKIKSSNSSVTAYIKSRYVMWYYNHFVANKLRQKYSYENNYICQIDDYTYTFIENHSSNHIFLRTKEMLNWQLDYSFDNVIGFDYRAKNGCYYFGGNVESKCISRIQVWKSDKLIGFYVVSVVNRIAYVQYLYYTEQEKNCVFASVIEKIFSYNIDSFYTFDILLINFARKNGIFGLNSKTFITPCNLTVPSDFFIDSTLQLQGGDGDLCC